MNQKVDWSTGARGAASDAVSAADSYMASAAEQLRDQVRELAAKLAKADVDAVEHLRT